MNALGHDYSKDWTIDKKATCTESGSKSHHCTRCDSKTDATVIPKLSHNYDNGVITTKATCTKDGVWSTSEWIQSGSQWWYRHYDGTYTTNDFEVIGNQTYYFDASSYMVTGWKKIGSNWYYFNVSGAMVKSAWQGNYYLEADGKMATNKWIGNYYVDLDGAWILNYK